MSIPIDHPFDFDPTYGLGLDELRAMRPPQAPPGFDEFWRARYVGALSVNPQPRLSESGSSHPNWRVHDIVYTSTDEFPIGGWLLLPQEGTVRRGLVVGHGYGGRDQPDFDIPVKETAVLFPCFRGLSRSSRPPISSDPTWHVLYGIEKPESYILVGCVEDLWLAVSVLTRLYPELDGRIGYAGASFGGGIGALGLAFDKRIDRGHLVVPTFGNMPLWLTLPTVGSAHSVQNYRKTHPDVLETLRLFDAATAAGRIEIPMLLAVARFDPAVAPPCQFSVANALPTSNHHETVILDAGHFDYPGSGEQHALLTEKVGRFFGAKCSEIIGAGAVRDFNGTWSC
jgi:cephalosporin-C deacetylase